MITKKKYEQNTSAYVRPLQTYEGRTDGLKSNLKRHGPVVITDVHTRIVVIIQAHARHGADSRFLTRENHVRFALFSLRKY